MATRARSCRPLAGLLALAFVLLACNTLTPGSTQIPPTPAEAVTSAPAVSPTPDDEDITVGIQATLDLYAQAFNDENRDLLVQVVDQTNKPFRRSVATRFDTYLEGFRAFSGQWIFTVDGIERRDQGFVLAHISVNYGLAADYLFREIDGVWMLSEPTVEQVGAEVIAEQDTFVFHTWPWADDINPTTIGLMLRARERVEEKLGQVPDEVADVYILPIYGLRPNETPQALAWYSPPRSQIDRDNMTILAANSFGFGIYDPGIGWEEELLQTMVHEYAHMTHQRSFAKAGKLSDWMVEGLAEWVSDSFRYTQVAAAVRAGHIIPIVDPSNVVEKQDLNHLTLLTQDVSLAYGYAASLVRFVVDHYGGLDGFWTIAKAYDATNDMDEALQQSFGITYQQFDSEWRAWLKETYE